MPAAGTEVMFDTLNPGDIFSHLANPDRRYVLLAFSFDGTTNNMTYMTNGGGDVYNGTLDPSAASKLQVIFWDTLP